MNKVSHHSRIFLATIIALLSAHVARGEFQWSSYDTSGNLVAANVATGGDLASGTSVTFTIPAGTQLFFVTKDFRPFSMSGPAVRKFVTFKVSASGGLTGVNQRTMGWGLYNSASTSGFTDDVGYFGLWNGGGPYVETYVHRTPTDGNNLFTGTNPGEGKAQSGTMADGVTYTNQIQLYMNPAMTGIALGSSSSTLATCGVAVNGPSLFARGYTNPYTPLLGGATMFDEFAFMFNNTTGSAVAVTLSAIGLGDSLTWDASGTNPTVPTDGSGNWSTSSNYWTSGVGGAIGAGDSAWTPGYNAVIGVGNGAAGTITITDPAAIVSSLTFNAPGSGSYTIAGNPLTFTNNPVVTVTNGVIANISSVMSGSGFTKEGQGQLKFTGGTANSFDSGSWVTINNGSLYHGSGGNALFINCNLQVNKGGAFISQQNNAISTNAILILNGGLVSNTVNQTTFNVGRLILDNYGVVGDGVGSTYFGATNYDLRSGAINCARYRLSIDTYKSTAGSVIITNRPNSSGTDGHIVTLNGGTLAFDKSSQSANRLKTGSPLTLGGGTLVFTNGNSGINPSTENPSAGGTFLKPGASYIQGFNAGASGGNITLGALNRNIGSTLDFKQTGPGTTTTTTANNNGILGGWATLGTTDWLAGTSFAAYSAYTTANDSTTWAAANNVSLAADPSASLDDTTINSLRLTAASTVTLNSGKTLTLSSGGLLVTGSGATAITGGNLAGGAAGTDLIINQYASADLTIASDLSDNSGSSLTKSGSGKLILTGANHLTGTNYLNGGTVEVSDLAKLASGALVMNAGTLRYTGASTTENRAVTLNGLGATFDLPAGTTLTLANNIKGSGAAFGDMGGLVKIGGGTLILTASNYFNGETLVSDGVLSINGTNAYDVNTWAAGKVTVAGGTLGGSGLISGAVTVQNGGTIAPGNSIGTLTLATNLTLESGSTNLFEEMNSSTGDLLVVQGDLTIEPNSTIAISVLGGALEPTTNTLITYTGTKTGSFNPVVAVTGPLNGSVTIDESTPGEIKLVVMPQVAIVGQPQDLIVSENDDVTFTVTATGSAPLHYQWYSYGDNTNNTPTAKTDATNASFTISSAQSADSGYYGVVVSNDYNAVTSQAAFLIVGNVLPILSVLTDKTVIQGNDVTFNVSVLLANPPADLQWRTNGTDVPGATGNSVTFHNVQYDMDGTTVSIVATNLAGNVTNSATLNVIVTPVISPVPTDLTVNVGDPASFVSGATGVPTPDLQWYKNGAPISGQTSGTLSIGSAQGSDVGLYALVATNAAGSVTSAPVKLTVVSTTLASATVSPANGATGVCYDTPLYVTFNGPISIVNSGRIQIFNVNSSTPVDTINMSSNTVFVAVGITNNVQAHSLFSGDSQQMAYFPVIITGNTAAIYPHLGVLTSNQTYYVTMDSGIVADSSGAYFTGISDTNAWKFTTKAGGPANPTNIVVAADGSGDFATVQGAVDSIPAGNSTFTLVNIRDGNYVEIVDISAKNNITFLGQSRKGTIVGYPNNNNLTPTTAGRMAFKVNSADISLVNLTITNGTVQGGSQAEALLIYNSGLRCVINNCDIISRQDTILINASTSQGYFQNCRVVGNFDYIWGTGVGYFTNCVFHTSTNTLSGSYNLTAARTATAASLSATTPWVNPNGTTYSAYGFSFVNCTFEADTGVSGITLAGSNGSSGGLDSWANCKFSSAYVTPSTSLTNSYVFWQNNNTDLAGNPLSFSTIQPIGNDSRLTATLSSAIWFSGWTSPVPNNNPTANVSTYSRPVGFSLKIAIAGDLATYWNDPDADPLALTGAISSTNSATVSYDGSYVYYSNPNDVADEIDYTISDGRGGSASGVINVSVVAGNAGGLAQNISTDGSAVTVKFSGIPDFRYDIERATDVNFTANLTVLITTNAPANGQFQFTDDNPPQPTAFYRLKYNP